MFDISLAPIFSATLVTVMFGMVWYSKTFFGTLWMREAGIRAQSGGEESSDGSLKAVIASLLQHFVIIYILAHIMLLAKGYSGVSSLLATVWVLLVVVASHMGSVIWEQRSVTYFAIHAGYFAVTLLLASTILTLWPWA